MNKHLILLLSCIMIMSNMFTHGVSTHKHKKPAKQEKTNQKKQTAPSKVLVPVNNTAFVDPVNGKDHGPNAGTVGQLTLPFKTIAAAAQAIAKLHPSQNNRFVIKLTAGRFVINHPQNRIQLPGFVDLIGSGTDASVIEETVFNQEFTTNPTPMILFTGPGSSAVRNLAISTKGTLLFSNAQNQPFVSTDVHEVGQSNFNVKFPDVPNTFFNLPSANPLGISFGALFNNGYYRFVDNNINLSFQSGPQVIYEGFAGIAGNATIEIDTVKGKIESIPLVPNPNVPIQTQFVSSLANLKDGAKIVFNGNTVQINRLTGAIPPSMLRMPSNIKALHDAAVENIKKRDALKKGITYESEKYTLINQPGQSNSTWDAVAAVDSFMAALGMNPNNVANPSTPVPNAQASANNNSVGLTAAVIAEFIPDAAVLAHVTPESTWLLNVNSNAAVGPLSSSTLPTDLFFDITPGATTVQLSLDFPDSLLSTSPFQLPPLNTLTSPLKFSVGFDAVTEGLTLTLITSDPSVPHTVTVGNQAVPMTMQIPLVYGTTNSLQGAGDLSFNRPPQVDTGHKINYVSLEGGMFYVPTAIALVQNNNTRTTGSGDAHSYGDSDYPDDAGNGDFSRVYADSNARHVTESQNSNTRTVPSGTTTDVFDTIVGVEGDPAGPTVMLHDATFTTGQLVKITNLDDTNDLTVTATPSSGFPDGFFFGEASDTIPPHQTHQYVAYANTDSQESNPPAGWLILRFVPGP